MRRLISALHLQVVALDNPEFASCVIIIVMAIKSLAMRVTVHDTNLLWRIAASLLTAADNTIRVGLATAAWRALESGTSLLLTAQGKATTSDEIQVGSGCVARAALKPSASLIAAGVNVVTQCTSARWFCKVIRRALEATASLLVTASV